MSRMLLIASVQVLVMASIVAPQLRAQDWDRTPEGRPLAVTPNARQREEINRAFAPLNQQLRQARINVANERRKIQEEAREHARAYERSLAILRRNQPVYTGFLAQTTDEFNARWYRAARETEQRHREVVASLQRRWQFQDQAERKLDALGRELEQRRARMLQGDFSGR